MAHSIVVSDAPVVQVSHYVQRHTEKFDDQSLLKAFLSQQREMTEWFMKKKDDETPKAANTRSI